MDDNQRVCFHRQRDKKRNSKSTASFNRNGLPNSKKVFIVSKAGIEYATLVVLYVLVIYK